MCNAAERHAVIYELIMCVLPLTTDAKPLKSFHILRL